MKNILLTVFITVCIASCTEQNSHSKKINKSWLNSIIKNSDSSYVKPYRRTDFVTATFYINKKDSSVCQLMKDSFAVIRQISIAKKNVRTFFAQYYSNGLLQAELSLDKFGHFSGIGKEYYENGFLKRQGLYKNGFQIGKWKNYDSTGKFINTDEYKEN